jgi:histidine triad (HIT) family protein
MGDTIFSKIIRKEIPAKIVFESETVLAFRDINPQAPEHILVIPKTEIPRITDYSAKEHSALLSDMIETANKIAAELGFDKKGFRLVINCGEDGGQEVEHLHIHILGGRKMNWPPG